MVAPTLYRSILRAAARLKDPRTGLIQFTEPVNARMWGHGPPPTPTLPPPLSRPWTSETLARPAVNSPMTPAVRCRELPPAADPAGAALPLRSAQLQ